MSFAEEQIKAESGIFAALAEYTQRMEQSMIKVVITIALACASIHAQVAVERPSTTAEPANRSIDWNRTLFARVRSPGAQATASHEALTGEFWNGAIQNYWNGIAQRAAAAHKLAMAQGEHYQGTFAGVTAFCDAKYTYSFWRTVAPLRPGEMRDKSDADNLDSFFEADNTGLDPLHPGAQPVIVAFHFQTRFTKLLRRIL